MTEAKKKLEKAEDFIGWKSEDGKLEVIGIYEKSINRKPATFKVTCTECSKDPELYPLGYFTSTKGNLEKGRKPCGCAFNPKWKDWQYLIKVQRIGKEKDFIAHGFAEKFHGQNTKLNLECSKDGHKWRPPIAGVINNGTGCPKCAKRPEITEKEAFSICVEICKNEGYYFVGFVNRYHTCKTKLKYICPKHGEQIVGYNNFVRNGNRCSVCARDRIKDSLKTPTSKIINECEELCKLNNHVFVGFSGQHINLKSDIQYICKTHGLRNSRCGTFINQKGQCPRCKGRGIPTQLEIDNKINKICKLKGWKFVKFITGYKNGNSKLEYVCPKHGKQSISYSNLLRDKGCNQCYEDRRKELSPGFYGWYPERAEEQDFIYVMNFNDKYIKVGRSFNVKTRNTKLKSESKIKNIKVLSVYTAKHGVIYPTEQEIHAELRERNFDYYPETWSSTECFQNDSLYVVEMLLEQSGLEKVEDYKKVKYNAKD